MRPVGFRADGVTLVLQHQEHLFGILVTDCAYAKQPDGVTDNPRFLATPAMPCQWHRQADGTPGPGCGIVHRSTFAIDGDAVAQRMHARYHLAAGTALTWQGALVAVARRAVASGAEPRFDPFAGPDDGT